MHNMITITSENTIDINYWIEDYISSKNTLNRIISKSHCRGSEAKIGKTQADHGSQPRTFLALLASPLRLSTSVGLKYLLSITTWSFQFKPTPHTQTQPARTPTQCENLLWQSLIFRGRGTSFHLVFFIIILFPN